MHAADEERRILFAVTHHTTAATFLAGLCSHLVQRGWRVGVIASPGPGLRVLEQRGVEIFPIAMEREITPLGDAAPLLRFRAVLREFRPALLVTATPKASAVGALAALVSGRVRTVHLLWGLRSETLSGWKLLLVRLSEFITCRLAARVLANSPSLRQSALAKRLASPRRIAVVGAGSSHGVDVDKFAPDLLSRRASRAKLGIQPDDVVVGFVGRLHEDKGVRWLLDAFCEVERRWPAATLLMVGSSEDAGVERDIHHAVSQGRRVRWLGKVDDVVSLYRAMDMFVLPSYREGFPNVMLEAAATGLPCITTNATGTRDSIVNETTGLLVDPNAPHQLSHRIGELMTDAERRVRMGAAGREWVIDRFEQTSVWKEYEAAFATQIVTP